MPDTTLFSLFLSAFISSTLFPGGSEALLVYFYHQDATRSLDLLWVATLGNTLGAMTSWGIGRYLARRYPARQWSAAHRRALERLQRYGSPVLLLSWLPIVGDPLCVAAGWLRIRWYLALIFIAIGKAARYGAVLGLAQYSL